MTLANFKGRMNFFLFLGFLAVYSTALFMLGRITQSQSTSESVKGVSTSQVIKDPIEKPQPYADEQKVEIISNSFKICSNSIYGFEISYPNNWFTTQNNDPQKCTYFAPFTFVVPQIVDSDIVPIKVEVAKVDNWSSTISQYTEPNDFQNINSIQNIEINGKPVIKVDGISTGRGQTQRGSAKVTYLIYDSKTPLILTYTQLDQNDKLEDSQKVLKDMAESIKQF